MRKEDEYVANNRGTLTSYDVNLKFDLVQLFQNAQKKQFLSSFVMSCNTDAYTQHPPSPLYHCDHATS